MIFHRLKEQVKGIGSLSPSLSSKVASFGSLNLKLKISNNICRLEKQMLFSGNFFPKIFPFPIIIIISYYNRIIFLVLDDKYCYL